jgi:hypothetical protein
MITRKIYLPSLSLGLLCLFAAITSTPAQQKQEPGPAEQEDEDVLRISTELVQTDNEFQAQAIERGEADVMASFIEQVVRENPMTPRSLLAAMIKQRAERILQQSSSITNNMLGSLDSLMRTATRLPGRKLTFFLSDGFLLETRNSDLQNRLRRVTTAAARAGVVVYTLDARPGNRSAQSDGGGIIRSAWEICARHDDHRRNLTHARCAHCACGGNRRARLQELKFSRYRTHKRTRRKLPLLFACVAA